jgi:hypothetical protein
MLRIRPVQNDVTSDLGEGSNLSLFVADTQAAERPAYAGTGRRRSNRISGSIVALKHEAVKGKEGEAS